MGADVCADVDKSRLQSTSLASVLYFLCVTIRSEDSVSSTPQLDWPSLKHILPT
jgi:hypothetical protein